jgi:pSer/pThr/pTyr-binding forkhead associated (FHA) protein
VSNYNDTPHKMGLSLSQKTIIIPNDEETLTQPPESRETRILPASAGARKPSTKPFNVEDLPERVQFVVRESGEVIESVPHHTLIIGRQNSSLPVDVDLSNSSAHEYGVSRNHVRIEPVSNGLLVRDLQTVNGSFLNGAPMHPMQAYELQHGDELKLGRIHLRVYFIYSRNHR